MVVVLLLVITLWLLTVFMIFGCYIETKRTKAQLHQKVTKWMKRWHLTWWFWMFLSAVAWIVSIWWWVTVHVRVVLVEQFTVQWRVGSGLWGRLAVGLWGKLVCQRWSVDRCSREVKALLVIPVEITDLHAACCHFLYWCYLKMESINV